MNNTSLYTCITGTYLWYIEVLLSVVINYVFKYYSRDREMGSKAVIRETLDFREAGSGRLSSEWHAK